MVSSVKITEKQIARYSKSSPKDRKSTQLSNIQVSSNYNFLLETYNQEIDY